MLPAFTHVGCRSHVGHVHCGVRLWGHRISRAGKRHALTGGPTVFSALCGKTVRLNNVYDELGYEVAPNVRPRSESPPVTCKRCLRVMKESKP